MVFEQDGPIDPNRKRSPRPKAGQFELLSESKSHQGVPSWTPATTGRAKGNGSGLGVALARSPEPRPDTSSEVGSARRAATNKTGDHHREGHASNQDGLELAPPASPVDHATRTRGARLDTSAALKARTSATVRSMLLAISCNLL
jgi:hypothetical protein